MQPLGCDLQAWQYVWQGAAIRIIEFQVSLTRLEHCPVPPVQLQRELDYREETDGERQEVGEEDEVEPAVEALFGVGVVYPVAKLPGPRSRYVHGGPGMGRKESLTFALP